MKIDSHLTQRVSLLSKPKHSSFLSWDDMNFFLYLGEWCQFE